MADNSEPVRFAIVGGGWRAEFYLRIARALPERFAVVGMVVRDGHAGARLEQQFGVPTHRTLDALLATCRPSFVVTSVSWAANPGLVRELVERGLPVLSETPPAPDLPAMLALWQACQGAPVQVAEQYIYQPHHAARLALIETGLLGAVSQAQVSAAHGYHGMSLIRHYLGIGYEPVRIRARKVVTPLVDGPNRSGPPTTERIKASEQTIAWLDWGDRFGVFDFCGDQYFSWIRNERVLIRGERGEIIDHQARVLRRYDEPLTLTLHREEAGPNGNLEGYYLQGITAGERWLYRNPVAPGRLVDDEIAVATSLQKMAEYVQGGDPPYPLAEACQDHMLSLLMSQAVESGEELTSEDQPWSTGSR